MSFALSEQCNALMEKVEKRLQGKGIKNYTLEWIDISTPTRLRVVGRCNKEKVKLVYAQHRTPQVSTNTAKNEVVPVEPEAVAQKMTTSYTPPPPLPTPTPTPTPTPEPITAPPTAPVSVPVPAPAPVVAAPVPAVATNSVQTLIQSLHNNTGAFASSIQELIDRADTTMPLVNAYYAAAQDATFRFNVVLLLNQKIKAQRLNDSEMAAVTQCLLDGLKDASSLVRGEALWGLGLTRNRKWAPNVNALMNDPDPAVRSEAHITSGLLR